MNFEISNKLNLSTIDRKTAKGNIAFTHEFMINIKIRYVEHFLFKSRVMWNNKLVYKGHKILVSNKVLAY